MSLRFDKSKDNQIRENGLIMSVDEVVDYMNTSSDAIGSLQKKVVEQQSIIEEKSNVITLMGAFIKSKGFSVDDFNEWISKDWHIGDGV